MSLKKRMFRSNMMILFLALFSLMMIILLVLLAFEDSFEQRLDALEQRKLDSNVVQAVSEIQKTEIENFSGTQQRLKEWGYETAVISGGKIEQGSRSEQMSELLEVTAQLDLSEEKPEIFFRRNVTLIAQYHPEGKYCVAAAHFPKEDWKKSMVKNLFRPFLIAFFLIGTGAILVILLLSAFFTRRMNRVVMEPLEKLGKGVRRIKDGNLREDIVYQGEQEFEDVCQVFNDMQHTILAEQEQQAKNKKARTDMVAGISHDLRTPLTSVQGYIKGVLDGVADTPEKEYLYLKTAYESTEEMNVLLQKLFDFSRMESGQMPFHMVSAELGEFTAACMAQKEAVMDSKQVQITMKQEPEWIPEVMLDVDQVRRIFDNLLENSLKYAMVRPVKIQIRVSEIKDFVLLEWKDNGKGVPEEKLDRIFERFYRCDESRNEKGSGIGLSVVKYIMERHNGKAAAENDQGLKVQLYFPKER